MITIKLDLHGTLTHASCTYLDGDKPRSFTAIENSGAKALTSLVEKLAKEKLVGLEYEVVGHPALSGIRTGKDVPQADTQTEARATALGHRMTAPRTGPGQPALPLVVPPHARGQCKAPPRPAPRAGKTERISATTAASAWRARGNTNANGTRPSP